jgi:predicted peptidase
MNRLFVTASLILLFSATTAVWGKESGFLKRRISIGGEEFIYQVHVPAGWTADLKWPVILFLHGAGERGRDGESQTREGIGPSIRKNPDRFPAIVVMPQCRRGVWWNDSQMEELVFQSLDRSIQEFNGDSERIYLTGLSMGGYGTFYFGARYPEKFAALAPICGGVVPPRELRGADVDSFKARYLEAAEKIGKTPTWIFHGSDDYRVPVSESRRMAEALEQMGGVVLYTEYEGVGHNSWDRAYSEPDLLPWLLSKSR